MTRTTRLARMVGMGRMNTDFFDRQVTFSNFLPVNPLLIFFFSWFCGQTLANVVHGTGSEDGTVPSLTTDGYLSCCAHLSIQRTCVASRFHGSSELHKTPPHLCRETLHRLVSNRNILGVLVDPLRFPTRGHRMWCTCGDARMGW